MNRIKLLLLLLLMCLFLPVCSSTVSAKKAPGTDPTSLKSLYAQKLPADGRGVEQLIARGQEGL